MIELTDQEIALLDRLVELRPNKYAKDRIGAMSIPEAARMGYGGELAFCKRFNVYPDFVSDDRGWDAILQECFIGIKTTIYLNGKLTCTLRDVPKSKAEYFALLVMVKFPKFDFKGFAERSDLLQEKNLDDLGNYGLPLYCLPQN